ncbi:hypothetical protein VaNZ11_008544 [Volvox africanus]|uniref:Sulfotransferase n=1 Tax=Volvox africanus TaxID=51714 RepID=A0ABQ5S6S6_9CHLO|nr:hypothetical protein VaNZ11_008544 [Volvox africanus]
MVAPLFVVAGVLMLALASCTELTRSGRIHDRLDLPLDYAVLGQQKSGTSTLWMHLKSHPDIAWVGKSKETLWFNGDYARTTLCDNDLEYYQRTIMYVRTVHNRAHVLVGDWSATHLSCLCCPLVFKMMNPKIKLLVVLREPVERALSRFMEQKVLDFGACHKEVLNETFASYVTKELQQLQRCRKMAARYRIASQLEHELERTTGTELPPSSPPSSQMLLQQSPKYGWGATMDLGHWMAAQCVAKSNIIGWSVYDVFLENYLAHFPHEQVQVLYTDDLAAHPLGVIRRVEAFLRVPPGNYTDEKLAVIYNSRGCYSWQCARNKTDVQWIGSGAFSSSSNNSGDRSSSSDSTSSGGTLQPLKSNRGTVSDEALPEPDQPQSQSQHIPQDGPNTQAVARLRNFYRPHMQRLFSWADQGLIAPPPASWRSRYESLEGGATD